MTSGRHTILVVDDEPAIRKLLRMGLTNQGHEVREAEDGAAAIAALERDAHDLVVLDLGLPDVEGHQLLAQFRSRWPNLPVIVLSSRDDESGKVEALDLGADDYVTKPFGMNELVARIRNALRHRLQGGAEPVAFQSGEVSVDLVRRIVTREGAEVKLTPKEFELLRLLVQHAGKVLTQAHLIQQVWGGAVDPQYLRVFIRQLRQKLERDPARPGLILTETGVGYRLKG